MILLKTLPARRLARNQPGPGEVRLYADADGRLVVAAHSGPGLARWAGNDGCLVAVLGYEGGGCVVFASESPLDGGETTFCPAARAMVELPGWDEEPPAGLYRVLLLPAGVVHLFAWFVAGEELLDPDGGMRRLRQGVRCDTLWPAKCLCNC